METRLNEKGNECVIPKNEVFTRKQVEKIVDRVLFFVSDNGDEITGKEYMDMYYPTDDKK